MSEKQIKVTDRRMFTPDGELREEYSHLDPANQRGDKANQHGDKKEEAASARVTRDETPPARPASTMTPAEPTEAASADAPGFFELIALLAEPASIYLRQSRVPDGQSAQNLEFARLHIDLLALLKQKTSGNLTPQEEAVLEDALYQLRIQFVEFGG